MSVSYPSSTNSTGKPKQPWVASADAEQHVTVSYGAEQVSTDADVNEAATLHWVALADVPSLIASGAVTGSASMVGLQAILLREHASS